MRSTSGGGTRHGSERWILVGGGLVIVILLVVLFAGSAAAPRVLGWGLGATRDRVIAGLPQEVPPIERQRLRRGFDCVIRRASTGEIDEERVGALSRTCNAVLADRHLSGDEVAQIRELVAALCPQDRRQ